MRDPVPPGHGEPDPVGARPGDYCACGRPKRAGSERCDICARIVEVDHAR